ncbi:hypothetical protein VW35_11200 [Devosia soli]|uniref:Uncharacterized protein n=1 Tax=Devosia soli TaxID=361041 RepID=A0A0F5L7L9_9HYPH|nr:hypothetical protein VW35_11200 [Devosia soli]
MSSHDHKSPLRTPDGRYIIVRGRLWRSTNPRLAEPERERLVKSLMEARRQVRSKDPQLRADARAAVDAAKRGLGERGPVWWTDGAPDYNRKLARNTPYADWFAAREKEI